MRHILPRRVFAIIGLAVVALVATACSSSPQVELEGDVHDFKMEVYQGQDVLGGREATFATVFAQGKPVVLNFWAGECPPCRAEMPAFQRAADEYRGKVVFVGVDVGPFTGLGSNDDARRLLAELRIGYPAARALDAAPLRLYGVRGMPTTIFFTARGQAVDRVSGIVLEDQLRGRLQKLVAGAG